MPGVTSDLSIPIVDLFAGPGGLGEGFTTFRAPGGRAPFRVRLSIEKDFWAHQTLTLRAFYRQFSPGRVSGRYYDVLRGTADVESLFARFPEESARAREEAWNAELGAVDQSELRRRIDAAVSQSDEWVLIGGPPCQAYSVAGRSGYRRTPYSKLLLPAGA
jgi:DNA (cytosine-5)-methyltransferase 1